jgi:SAM-dependent methyltransferase
MIARAQNSEHHGEEMARDPSGHVVINCLSCGFAHFWPRPTAEELSTYYAQSFYETHSPPDWSEKEAREQPYWKIEHLDRLSSFSQLLGRETGKLLDVGCGGAWLLEYAAQRNWETLGIEPSRFMWERACRRGSVLLGMFPEVDLTNYVPFDVVNLKLVLEHVLDPLQILLAARQTLRPGGIVCVQVPNDFNELQTASCARLGKSPWWLSYPAHINYFGFGSLERLLSRAGFQPLLRQATYPMEWFLLQGIDYIGQDETGRQCHAQRMQLEMNLEAAGLGKLRRSFSAWLAEQGIGREAIVFAAKPQDS